MGAIMILLISGICVFLIWFFAAILKDVYMDDCRSHVYIDLRTRYQADASEDETVFTHRAS